jgi:hypothetical protein
MSKDGYYGDFGSFAEEQEAYRQHQEQNQEPDVVPCKCGNPMYETEEMCDQCKLLTK